MNTTYIVKHIQKGLALLPALVAFVGGPGCDAWGVASAGELVLAERGRPAAYTIVRPAQASASEVYAAEELRDGLARATGVTLPITADDRPLPDKAIVIGAAACARAAAFAPDLAARLGEDGFRLEVRGTRLFVYGSAARGALYGVYALLEDYAGCRWYASWHTLCPPRAQVAVPDNLAETQVPAFAMREPYWYDVIKHPAFAARLRVNSRSWRTMDARYGGNPFRFGGGLGSCHTFNTLMPPDEFFDAHPEYFSYEDGRRVKHPSQLCLTNPDVLLLDEPTNDLDVATLRSLEEGLQEFGGCVMVVSHDRWFLDRIATHILAFEGKGKTTWFEGSYSEYHEMLSKRR